MTIHFSVISNNPLILSAEQDEKSETFFFFDENNNVISGKGNKLWATVFTRCLSEAKTIDEAIQEATNAVYLEHTQFYGLDSHYVAGDRYQVVKH